MIARPPNALRILGAGVVVLLVLIAPELSRVLEFRHFKAFSSATANAGGLGNLRHQLSPFEALGVWPTSEFRLAAGDASHPILFYAGSLLALAGLGLGLPRWVRARGWALPAAIGSAALIYVIARVSGTVYTSAKALAIAAPLVMLAGLGGLVSGNGSRRFSVPRLLAVGLGVVALASSFLVLRQAPVGPTTHADELATFRPLLQGKKVLFLGRDDFIQYELRGARPYVAVRNYYDNYYVQPNLKLANVFEKFDFDSVKVADLAKFKYVITTRAAYASGAPLWLVPVRETPTFVLWEQIPWHHSYERRVLAEGDAPAAKLDCRTNPVPLRGTAAIFPTFRKGAEWSGGPTVEGGAEATTNVTLTPGIWDVSLQYDATRPVHLSAPGLDATIPANLDYRGTTPYYPAGSISVTGRGPVTVSVSVERPPLVGRLFGTKSVAHLGSIAFTTNSTAGSAPFPAMGLSEIPLRDACGQYVDWYNPSGGPRPAAAFAAVSVTVSRCRCRRAARPGRTRAASTSSMASSDSYEAGVETLNAMS